MKPELQTMSQRPISPLTSANDALSTSVRPIPVFSARKCVVPRYITIDYSVETQTFIKNFLWRQTKTQPRTLAGKASNSTMKVEFGVTTQKLRREQTVVRSFTISSATGFETLAAHARYSLWCTVTLLPMFRYHRGRKAPWIFEPFSSCFHNGI